MTRQSLGTVHWTRIVVLGAVVIVSAPDPAVAVNVQATEALAQRSAALGRAASDSGPSVARGLGGPVDTIGAGSALHPDSAAGGVHTGGGVDLVAAATRDYQRTGVAKTVEEGAFMTFPYGHSQPTVTCAPLRACVIELQAGETVLSKIAGDTQRWEIQLAPAGSDGRTPLVVVKPHDCGLTTNLVLATTAGRIYDLTLDSPPCARTGGNPRGAYVRHVRFYYPDAMVQAWTTPASAAAIPAATIAAPVSNASAGGTSARFDALNFEYRVHRDKGFPWSPLAVFDDGVHCYIKLPPLAAHREAPVLFVLREDGSKAVLNYSVSGDTYTTDRIFRSAVLVIGDANQERTVRLDNMRFDPPAAEGPAVGGDGGGGAPPTGGPHG
jgi:type IV secretion system protein TrbG